MLIPKRTKQFKTEYKRLEKSGKDISKLDQIIIALCSELPLKKSNKDHGLRFNWKGYRECHVEPDWLLIYKIESDSIIFVSTGSHAELFDK